jgi:hypothetical protein
VLKVRSLTTRAFQITVNHRRQILSTTLGLPGRWNDKTVVRFDGLLTSIHNGKLYQDVKFNLLNAAGEITEWCGVWILVDGGYLPWSCTLCPLKETESVKAARWSKWAESMRKDVECTFGILKGRWRILKTGIRIQNLTTVDNIWFTCCALHNLLLHADGLHERWREGVPSLYEGDFGYHEYSMVERHVPLVFARANAGGRDIRRYDATCNIQRTAAVYYDEEEENLEVNNNNEGRNLFRVNSTNNIQFRNAVIEHFHYLWLRNEVAWPSRTGNVSMVN